MRAKISLRALGSAVFSDSATYHFRVQLLSQPQPKRIGGHLVDFQRHPLRYLSKCGFTTNHLSVSGWLRAPTGVNSHAHGKLDILLHSRVFGLGGIAHLLYVPALSPKHLLIGFGLFFCRRLGGVFVMRTRQAGKTGVTRAVCSCALSANILLYCHYVRFCCSGTLIHRTIIVSCFSWSCYWRLAKTERLTQRNVSV